MTDAEWAFVDQLRAHLNRLEGDLLQQKCRLDGFSLETNGGNIKLVVDFTPHEVGSSMRWDDEADEPV